MSIVEEERDCINCDYIGVSGLDMPCSACLEVGNHMEYWAAQ